MAKETIEQEKKDWSNGGKTIVFPDYMSGIEPDFGLLEQPF
ncbi:hypothetical protein [Virgibacillus indicus]|nr:hypothetical protein [Virgibacillus indicus]